MTSSEKGIIFNIQRYSIHDGPGIRTTIFFKGCPLKCFWCQNPESQHRQPEILLKKGVCTGCGQCVSTCPNQASVLNGKTAVILREKCTSCGKCISVCPAEARSLAGKQVTADEVVGEVLKDKKYYVRSGGGVTLSGGEPTAQPEFALSILRQCKEAGLHNAIETCGFVSWTVLEETLKYVDLVLFDIKCLDPVKHWQGTGVNNDLIIDNVRKVARIKPMRVRVPLIPTFNADVTEVSKIINFARQELKIADIDLLAYNKFGEGKYEHLGRTPVLLPELGDELKKTLDNLLIQ